MSDLIERLRSSAKIFRENPVYDSGGDGVYLIAEADRCDEAARELEAQQAEIARLRELVNALCEAECECDPAYSTQVCLRCKTRAALEQKP